MAARWRPDPAKGIFETLLVLGGCPVERDAHLARLQSSLTALYPHLTPPSLDVPSLMHPYGPASDGTSDGALRITVAPDASGRLAATAERRAASGHFATENGGQSTTRPTALRSLTLPGGLGAHKWADRSLLDDAQAKLPTGALALILDDDGTALEVSRANIFAVRDGALFTPPLDGRILPGITRMRVLEIAGELGIETREEPLAGDELRAADEVFLTGSVRGIEPAASLDGQPLPGAGEIAGRLAAGLRRAWTGLSAAASFG